MPSLLFGNSDLVVEVDEVDYLYFWMYSWTLGKDGYAICSAQPYRNQRLHALIGKRMKIVGMVDHADRNKLNCKRENLRPATQSQSTANSDRPNTTTGFRGVRVDTRTKKFSAMIFKDGQHYYLGYFNCASEAAIAYDKKAIELYGEYAVTNFPKENYA